MSVVKTISFGGLGDAFIVGCKLDQLFHTELFNKNSEINHLFVESNVVTCAMIREYIDAFWKSTVHFSFEVECDLNYQQSFYAGHWPDRLPINTTWHGDYRFPGPDGIKLIDLFADVPNPGVSKFDVCIQVAAGAQSNRRWKFDPRKLRDLLIAKQYRTALIGTAEKFKEDERFNFVGKTDLQGSINVVAISEIYVGLSGFHTYHSLARRIKNIHLEESDEHNSHYIHPSWEKYRYGIKHGSLTEVVAGLRHWGVKI